MKEKHQVSEDNLEKGRELLDKEWDKPLNALGV